MKLNKILSYSALALAAVFSACSDDEKYTPGAQSPGAYFPETNPATITVGADESSFNVTIMRVDDKSAETVNISCTDENNLFTFPTSVSFAAGATSAEITIGYDPEKMEYKEKYPASITIADEAAGTQYGPSSYSFDVMVATEFVGEYWNFGEYTYTAMLSGYQTSIPIYKGHTVGDIESDTTIVVGGLPKGQTDASKFVPFFGGMSPNPEQTLVIKMHYADAQQGLVPITIEPQSLGYQTKEGELIIADYGTWFGAIGMPDREEALYGSSYYDTERGLFDIYAIYYTNEMEAGYAFGAEYEALQIDGFPNYTISAEFAGLFTAPDFTQTYAMLNVDSGEDLNEVRIAVSGKLTAQEIFDGIKAGTVSYESVASGEGQEARIPVFGDGLHIAVAVGYCNDEPVSNYVLRFNVGSGTTVPNDPTAWKTYGWADISDGFVLPLVYSADKQYADTYGSMTNFLQANMFQVEIQSLIENPNILRLVNPYGAESEFPFASQNSVNPNQKFNIVFDCSDPECVVVNPQYTGFLSNSVDKYIQGINDKRNPAKDHIINPEIVYNVEGELINYENYSIEQVKNFFKKNRMNLSTYTEEDGLGIIAIRTPYPAYQVYNTYRVNPVEVTFVLDEDSPAAKQARGKAALKTIRNDREWPLQMRSEIYFTIKDFRTIPSTSINRFK